MAALWKVCFPDARPWSQPREVIRRKLAVQPDLLLVGTLDACVVATVVVGYDGQADGSTTSPSLRIVAAGATERG